MTNILQIHASTLNCDPENTIRVGTDLRFVDSSKPWDKVSSGKSPVLERTNFASDGIMIIGSATASECGVALLMDA
jgi:hypothetical protein